MELSPRLDNALKGSRKDAKTQRIQVLKPFDMTGLMQGWNRLRLIQGFVD